MGGFDVQPGATTSDAFATQEPTTEAIAYNDSYGIGEKAVVDGPFCNTQPKGTHNCFLPPDLRERLANNFATDVDAASNAYRSALLELKAELLLAKDDELPLMFSIAIDVACAFISSTLARAVKTASVAAIAAAREMRAAREVAGAIAAPDATWESTVRSIVAAVSPDHLETLTNAGFKTVALATKNEATKGPAREPTAIPAPEEGANTHERSYIDVLRDGCDVAFHRFKLDAIASSTDAELIVLYHGMKREHHTPGMYKAALKAKLARFMRSGVPQLGVAKGTDPRMTARERRRVVWVQDGSGRKNLWFQTETFQTNVHSEPGGDAEWVEWGHRFNLDRPVPDEFVDVAMLRSEQLYGPTRTIERKAPLDAYMRAFGHYTDAPMKPKHPLAPPREQPYPSGSVFAIDQQVKSSSNDPLAPFGMVTP